MVRSPVPINPGKTIALLRDFFSDSSSDPEVASVLPSVNSSDSVSSDGLHDAMSGLASRVDGGSHSLSSLPVYQSVDDMFGGNSYALSRFFNEQSDLAFNKSQSSADTLMNWQERMSNTSMQRRMADLKAAGLNPKLAYQLGGADIGSGATAAYDSVADTLIQALISILSSDTTMRGQDISKKTSERSQNMSLAGDFLSGWFNMVSSLMNSKEMLS